MDVQASNGCRCELESVRQLERRTRLAQVAFWGALFIFLQGGEGVGRKFLHGVFCRVFLYILHSTQNLRVSHQKTLQPLQDCPMALSIKRAICKCRVGQEYLAMRQRLSVPVLFVCSKWWSAINWMSFNHIMSSYWSKGWEHEKNMNAISNCCAYPGCPKHLCCFQHSVAVNSLCNMNKLVS